MEIQEATFKNFGSSRKIQIFENKVAYQYWSPWYKYSYEFKYADLRTEVAKEKMGDDMWTDAGWYLMGAFFLWILFLIFFAATFIPESGIGREAQRICFRIATGVGLGLISLAIASFILSWVRYEFFVFITKMDIVAFRIKYSKRNKAIAGKMVESILENIKKDG